MINPLGIALAVTAYALVSLGLLAAVVGAWHVALPACALAILVNRLRPGVWA